MRLENGIETIELGATSWRVMINENFKKVLTQEQINKLIAELVARIEALESEIASLKNA